MLAIGVALFGGCGSLDDPAGVWVLDKTVDSNPTGVEVTLELRPDRTARMRVHKLQTNRTLRLRGHWTGDAGGVTINWDWGPMHARVMQEDPEGVSGFAIFMTGKLHLRDTKRYPAIIFDRKPPPQD
ncbi:MAG: hypothetical protein MK101_07165 [Phycisphaerales bacterium]|nr:hypothetical protein [Phycisphaerales bacterium]